MALSPAAESALLPVFNDRSVEDLAERIGVAIAQVVAAVQAEGIEDDDRAVDARVRRWLFRLELEQRTQCLALALSEHWQIRCKEIARAVQQDTPWSLASQYPQFAAAPTTFPEHG